MKKVLLTLGAALCCAMTYAQTSLLTNGSFENGVEEGWTPTEYAKAKNATVSESSEARTGAKAALVAGKSGSNVRMASSDYLLKAGTYTFKAYAKAATEDGAAVRLGYVPVADGAAGQYYYTQTNLNGFANKPDTVMGEWVELTYTFQLEATTKVDLIVMNNKTLGKDALIDDCTLTTEDGGIAEETEQPSVDPDEPADETNDFVAALTDAQGNWTFEDELRPDELSYVWQQTTTYGMKATAYVGGTNYATKSYLVSPAITLEAGKTSVLTFEHAAKFGTPDNYGTDLTLWVREADDPAWVAQIAIPAYPAGTDWNYIASGDIDLSAYAGKTIQLGWCYTSTAEGAATWELKNVRVTNAAAAEAGPVLKDPTNTAATAYTVAEARTIIDQRAQYDMSKEVYVKGIVAGIKSIDVSQYERAQYWIVDQVGGDSLLVYNGYYLNGDKFEANDQIKEGDAVIVCGTLTLYGATYEFNQNNRIVEHNGNTANAITGVKSAQKAVIYDLQGRRVDAMRHGLYIVDGKKVVK